jgi:hypothetical protein
MPACDMNQLSTTIKDLTGMAWNKKFRKSHGTIRDFVTKESQIFLFDAAKATVALLPEPEAQKAAPQEDGDADGWISGSKKKGKGSKKKAAEDKAVRRPIAQ